MNTPTLWLSEPVYRSMADEAQRHVPNETGGVLLGYWSEREGEPVVTHCLGPGPDAVHQRSRFVPDHHFHVVEIARLYRTSGRRMEYLGDWHTHPGNRAYLSDLDLQTLKCIAVAPKARAPRPVMAVLAPGPIWEICAWRARVMTPSFWRRELIIHPLSVVRY